MEATLIVLNELEREGVISRYAIGGAVGAIFYMEPFLTYDLDVFVLLPRTSGGLVTLAPIYESLKGRGCEEDGECLLVEGMPVQFLPVEPCPSITWSHRWYWTRPPGRAPEP